MSNTTTTQTENPWKTLSRTIFQMIIGLAVILPQLMDASGVDEAAPWAAVALGISGAITRIMSLPAVEDFLRKFLPFLAASKSPLE